jgi:outer membrane protein OmpA-like peptidoglycan-associated protein
MATPRVLTIALVVLLALATGAAYLGVRHLRALEQQVSDLGARSDAADDRAAAAAARALQAEEAAQQAAHEAQEAAQRAAAEQEARLDAENARLAAEGDADMARLEAEYADERATAAQAEAERLRVERDAEMQRLQDALGSIADTQRTALGLVMNLGADAVNFDTDEAVLKAEDRELLARVAGVLLTSSGFRIQVFGHTDDVGTAEHNQGLSERRARAVRDYLVGAGLSPSIITTKGFGQNKPLVPGTSDAARARNRRVEIGIIDSTVRYSDELQRERRP